MGWDWKGSEVWHAGNISPDVKYVKANIELPHTHSREGDTSCLPNRGRESRFPAGVSITLYDGAGFGGKNQIYTENTTTLGDMRSIASSLKTALVGK